MSDEPYKGVEEYLYPWWRTPRKEDVEIPDLSKKLNELYEKAQKEAEQSLWEGLFGK